MVTTALGALVLVALALVIWPTAPTHRLARLRSDSDPGRGAHPGVATRVRRATRSALGGARRGPVVAGIAAAGLGTALVGPLTGSAAGLAALTTATLLVQAAATRRRRAVLTELTVTLRALVRELAAGAPATQACARVARIAGGRTAEWLDQVAGELRLGLDAPTRGRRTGRGADPVNGRADAEIAVVTGRVRSALHLSSQRGVPAVELITAVAADVDAKARMADRQAAEVAGPRLSGYLLAALPALGLVLGTAMRAHPIPVLLNTGIGQLLLVVGVALTCLGLSWISRIVR